METELHIYRLPTYDQTRRLLRLGWQVIKHFKQPAGDQEAVLLAFEEEGWPERIDDPLPPRPETDAKRRLHETITNLNRNQQYKLIRFRGDGTGQGVLWELIEPAAGASVEGAG